MGKLESLENILMLAVIGIVIYFLYEAAKLFGIGTGGASGGSYCNDNPDSILCKLFSGGPNTGTPDANGNPTACIGIGCTGNLAESYWCTYFPSTCASSSASQSAQSQTPSADTSLAYDAGGGGGGF